MDLLAQIPEVFTNFLITLAFSLLLGLEQRKRSYDDSENTPAFGTDRTLAFIGMLGFILYTLAPQSLVLYITGACILGVLLGIFYYTKIRDSKAYGLTSILVALVTYTIGPLVISQPLWITVVIVVSVLILVERKEFLGNVSRGIDMNEFTTLAKFLVIAGVILPISPKSPEIPIVELSAYTIWLTVVVVSTISYASYLLQKFVFKNSGIIVSGILGGLYSSTATTVILAKRSRELPVDNSNLYSASIITASAMMYLRIMVLMFIFNSTIGYLLLPYFIILIAVSVVTAVVVYFTKRPLPDESNKNANGHTNPLELKTAMLFAVLFIFFSMTTHYILSSYGTRGLNVLSFAVGFTDIDPFLLNLFQGNYGITPDLLAKAALHAVISNNILKAVYTFVFGDKHTSRVAIAGLTVITVVNIILAIII